MNLYMLPSLSLHYHVDVAFCCSKGGCHNSFTDTIFSKMPDELNICFFKLGQVASLAWGRISTALHVPISIVVRLSAKKEMVRVNAGRIIAFVQNKKAIRHWTISKLPRNSVCEKVRMFSRTDGPVSIFIPITNPFPAFPPVVEFNPGPKSLLQCDSSFRSSHGFQATNYEFQCQP